MGPGGFTTEAKVGIFVIITVFFLVYMSVRINRGGFSMDQTKTIYVQFDNASGLLKRTPVEFAGIRVGTVEDIELVDGKARVQIKIDPRVPVYQDSSVVMQNRGILGEKILSVSGGGREPELPAGGQISALGGTGGIDEAFRNFNEVAGSIRDMIKGGEGRPSLNDIITNVTEISEDLRMLVKQNKTAMGEIIKNVHSFSKMLNEGDIKTMIVNLKDASEQIKAFVSDADPQLRDVVSDFKGVMGKIDNTVSSLNNIVSKVERGEGTIGKLLSDETTVNKVNETLDSVNDMVGRMRRLEVAVGFRGEYLSSSRSVQSTASLRIQPNYDKYFQFEFVSGPLDMAKRTTRVKDETSGGVTTQTTTVERTDKFSFTLLFAKRIYDVTLKAGMMRSTGGFGVEYFVFRDRLSFGADFFDFTRAENPHIRLYAMAHLWKIFKLIGGVDDIAHEQKRRNYFGGLGIVLTDNDLKALVGLSPLLAQ